MEIIIGKNAGFCFGVANAVNKTNKLLEENNNICVLGELVHNKQVINDLQKKGLRTIENIKEANNNVIIRTHGGERSVYEEAKKMELEIFDLTCPKVLKIHDIVVEYSNKGYYILLIGKKNHPEVIATISYCGKYANIIEDDTDLKEKFDDFYNSGIKNLLVIAQTTYSLERFNEISKLIEEDVREHKEINIEIKKTICDATKIRQEETETISKKVDIMIIIGGKHSSNTNKLYEIAKKNCKNSILVETEEEIDIEEIKKYNKIGIMAGASTPKKSIDLIVEKLKYFA